MGISKGSWGSLILIWKMSTQLALPSAYSFLSAHTVWQLATLLLCHLDLAGILLFAGRRRYLCCATDVSHSCADCMATVVGNLADFRVACGVSPDLEASLLGAAIFAEKPAGTATIPV
jgi:hypothetical protein